MNDQQKETTVTFLGAVCLALLLLTGTSAHAEEAEADSTQIARPSFSMTPT